MAKFTMTIGEMVTAYRKQLQITKADSVTLPDGTNWTFNRLNQIPTLQTTITDYSYPWLIHEIEQLKEDYSDDSDLNRSISNQLAQTFVRHFWQYEIGFETPDVFAIQLRAFFDEYMPIFIKWYQQFAIQNQSYLTAVTNLTRNVDGTIHMTGTGKADGSLNDKTTTDGTTNQNGTAKTTGKTTDNETGSQTGTMNQSGKTTTTGKTTDNETGSQTGTTKTNGEQSSQDKSLSGTADTPQDQLNTDFGAGDPTSGYKFDYASQVVGSNTTNNTTSSQTQTNTSDTQATKNGTSESDMTSSQTQKTSSDTQATRNGTSESDTITTDAGASHSETDRTQTTSNATQNTNDQTSNNKEGTQTQDRTQTIMDLTNQLLNYVDGLYLDMFERMLNYGLFMQVF